MEKIVEELRVVDKIKVLTVFGTRPEAIKMAPLIKELEKREIFNSVVCVTAQHREMLDQVLNLFEIVPDYDLNIMSKKQSLSTITCKALEGLEEVIQKEMPDIVLVHGDTTTTFAASLAAFYNKSKVGHIEAGLRTFDKYFPFPEEMNRRLTSNIADFHFAPTELNKNNLESENISADKIFVTGNTVIDAMKYTVKEDYKFRKEELNNIDYKNKKVIMVTAHRRENWGKGIDNICNAINKIVKDNEDVEVVYLVHLNPIVKDAVEKKLKGVNRVHLLEPLDTEETHNLMNKCYMIMTDSGGIQEEAPHLGKPVLVLRDITERQEAVEAGTVKLVGTYENKIVETAKELLNNINSYMNMSNLFNPYGDGTSSVKICNILMEYLK